MVNLSNFKNVLQLLDHFKSNDTCKKYLEQQRWGKQISCPHCGYCKVYRTNRGFSCANKDCKKKFSVTVGTVMENTKIELRLWFAAIYLLTSHKKGISSLQLSKDLGITQKTAWFLNHRIRKMMNEQMSEQKLTGVVQIDETYIGGKRRNMHGKRRKAIKEKYGAAGSSEKFAVFGMIQNNEKFIALPVPIADGETLKPIIRQYVDTGATIVTDQHGAYSGLDKEYNHIRVNHQAKNYVSDSGHHNNSIESAWVNLKRGYIGIYHYMSAKHLSRYCNEFSYRYNYRQLSDMERFSEVMQNLEGRLKYKDLIAA